MVIKMQKQLILSPGCPNAQSIKIVYKQTVNEAKIGLYKYDFKTSCVPLRSAREIDPFLLVDLGCHFQVHQKKEMDQKKR